MEGLTKGEAREGGMKERCGGKRPTEGAREGRVDAPTGGAVNRGCEQPSDRRSNEGTRGRRVHRLQTAFPMVHG